MMAENKFSDGYSHEQIRQLYIDYMQGLGFKIVLPEQQELQIDIDSEEQFQHFLAQWQIVITQVEGWSYVVKESRSGFPKRHITVTTDISLTVVERIAWQAVLGSDPKRELLSMMRYDAGVSNPTLFVEKSDE
jgi:hypothetical protein